MFYEFPKNLMLDEVREVVRSHNEALGVTAFIEADRGEFVIFNYVVSFDGSFPDFTGDAETDRRVGIIRELRGLTFFKDTGEVAIRKFHKFFNVGQREETQAHVIDWSQPHTILMKLDGSMLSPYKNRSGQWEWHTKMGATDVANLAQDFVDSTNIDYNGFAEEMSRNGITPLFEFCSRKQKIVIDYVNDQMVLLALRSNLTGEYLSYQEMIDCTEPYGIPVVEVIDGSVNDPTAFLEQVRVLVGAEGYVIRFDNGHMVKVKAEEYLRLHNMVDMLQLEKNVLALVLSGKLDDAKALMTDDSRVRVEAYAEAVERGMAENADRLTAVATEWWNAAGQDQKAFATEYVNASDLPAHERGLVFRIARGMDALDLVREHVEKNTSTGTKVDSIRYLVGDSRWDDFRDHSIVVED